MAQAIVCYNHEGLVLATDSLVVQELDEGQVERSTARRLFALGTQAAMVAAGAPLGLELATELARWLQARHLVDLDDVLAVSREFLAEGYARPLRAHQALGEERPAAFRHLYFIVGGYAGSARAPYQAILLCSEAGELPFQEVHLGRVFTLPRRLGLEVRVTRRIAEGAGLNELATTCRAALKLAAERNPELVGGPIDVATVSAGGVAFLDETGEEA